MASLCKYVRQEDGKNEAGEVISYQIILEESLSECDSSDAESIESFQANTTVSAKDSSDISTEVDIYYSEYEIASSPDPAEPVVFDKETFSSSSSPRDITVRCATDKSCESDSTDVSEEDSDTLGMLPDNKYYHTCAQCFLSNTNPAFRFCDSCYQLRKEFYPSKPAPKNKRKNRRRPHQANKKCKTTSSETENLPGTSKAALTDTENIPGTSKAALTDTENTPGTSKATFNNTENVPDIFKDSLKEIEDTTEISAATSMNSEISSQPSYVSSTFDSGFESLSPSAEWELAETKEKCLTCLTETVNGLFLHGKTCHRCCCYKCSKRIWYTTRKCPMCRRKIHNVSLLLNC